MKRKKFHTFSQWVYFTPLSWRAKRKSLHKTSKFLFFGDQESPKQENYYKNWHYNGIEKSLCPPCATVWTLSNHYSQMALASNVVHKIIIRSRTASALFDWCSVLWMLKAIFAIHILVSWIHFSWNHTNDYSKHSQGVRVMNFWKRHENPCNVLGHYHF